MYYETMIKSPPTYKSETWRLKENLKVKLKDTEMDALKRPARISKLHKIKNAAIRNQMGVRQIIIADTEKKRLSAIKSITKKKKNGRT